LTVLAITGLVLFSIANAYADHVDNNIWIETADNNFITMNPTAGIHLYEIFEEGNTCSILNPEGIAKSLARHEATGAQLIFDLTSDLTQDLEFENFRKDINNVAMIQQYAGCGNERDERAVLNAIDTENIATNDVHKWHHECLCGYWYSNTIKDEYTFTITELSDRRELPTNYEREVREAIQAGLDLWGDANDITFTYTDSRLRVDIVIQQDIHRAQYDDVYTIANGDLACLLEDRQCTIQLFTDLNLDGHQTLLTPEEIEETIAHELGHNFGLPHNIEHDNIMASLQDEYIRTYYEARGIKVPGAIVEHTHEDEDEIETTTSNDSEDDTQTKSYEDDSQIWTVDNFVEHKAAVELFEVLEAILLDTPVEERFSTLIEMSDNILNELWDTIFN
jgi:hypothetical protein